MKVFVAKESWEIELQQISVSNSGCVLGVNDFGAVPKKALDALINMPSLPDCVGQNYKDICESLIKSPAYVIVELIDECDLTCPTCIAASMPGLGKQRTVGQVKYTLQTLIEKLPSTTKVMLSGGEPTLHRNLVDILKLEELDYFDEVFLITNGLKLSRDKAFLNLLKASRSDLHIYLQVDSFDAEDLIFIRGKDYSNERNSALINLEEVGLNFTAVCVVMRDINSSKMGEIVSKLKSYKYCRGVTFQPVKFMGRIGNANPEDHFISTYDAVKILVEQLNMGTDDIAPHPLNPLNWAISYFKHDQCITNSILKHFEGAVFLPKALEATLFRVAVIWHTGFDNFVLESVAHHPICFADGDEFESQEVFYS